MLISEAFTNWREEIRPLVVAQYGEDDSVALSESWNDYTDSLCKEGDLTDLQYHFCPAYDDDIPGDADDEREYLLAQLGVTFKARQVDTRPDADTWHEGARHFAYVIRRGKQSMRGFYSMGAALNGLPDLVDVLSCILSDTVEIENGGDFADWCDAFGYDEDSRKAERTFKACQREHKALSRLFSLTEIEGLRAAFEDF